MNIKNSVVIVTGASQGIGEAVAKNLADQGAKVVLVARSKDKLAELSKNIPGSHVIVADMRNEKDIKKMIDETVKKLGRVDILINNAGQGMHGSVESIDIETYKDVMELNVYGVLRAMQAAIPVMRKQGGGMIMNISSMVSKNYFPGLAAYASTKYALNCLTLTAREELAGDKIIVNAFHPKMTATNFMDNMAGGDGESETDNADNEERRKRYAHMKIDTAEDVAEKIADLIDTEDAEANM